MSAALALVENRIPEAEQMLREHLKRHPTDVVAIRMLAEVAARIGRGNDAENSAGALPRAGAGFPHRAPELRHGAAPAEQVGAVAARGRPAAGGRARATRGCAISRRRCWCASASTTRRSRLYRAVLRDYPRQPKVWMSLGHALKTANHHAEAIEAYRRCIALSPEFGEVWWSLANLKTLRFTADDVASMRAQLARADLTNDDRFHFISRSARRWRTRATSPRRSITTRRAMRCAAS